MKIVLTCAEVEAAVIKWLKEEKNITAKQSDIKWTEGLAHPVHPIHLEIK